MYMCIHTYLYKLLQNAYTNEFNQRENENNKNVKIVVKLLFPKFIFFCKHSRIFNFCPKKIMKHKQALFFQIKPCPNQVSFPIYITWNFLILCSKPTTLNK